MSVASQSLRRPHLKSIALPAEHGGWGFLLEPFLLGIIAAFGGKALVLGLAMLSLFLVHQPLKIAAKDRWKGKYTQRTRWAERFGLVYAGVGVLLLALLVVMGSGRFLFPFLLALPLMVWQFKYDLENRSRELVPELCGAVALGAIASAIALLKEWEMSVALGLWLITVLRTVPAILYVRARLRLERDKALATRPVYVAHFIALLVSIGLTLSNDFPLVVSVWMGLFLLRAVWGLSPYRKPAPRPAIIGIRELIYGILFAVAVGLGYAFA